MTHLPATTRRAAQGLLVCLLAALSAPVTAKDGPSAFEVYVENDSRLLKPNHNTDRHYTAGTKLVYVTDPDWQWLEDFSRWHFAADGQNVETAVGFFLGQNIYTPDHVESAARRNPADHVFAGWLYTGLFAQRATADVMDHVELNIGVIGPSSQAQAMQEQIHDLLHSSNPEGWADQIGDEPAVDIRVLRQQRITDGWLKPTATTDVIAEYGFTAGSVHRHVQAGLTVRWGRGLGKTFVPGRLELPSGVTALRDGGDAFYLFARAAGKAIEHNRFLTGLDAEPFMGEFQVGAVYQRDRLELGYSQTFFTRQFEQQSGKDSFGAVTLAWRF